MLYDEAVENCNTAGLVTPLACDDFGIMGGDS